MRHLALSALLFTSCAAPVQVAATHPHRELFVLADGTSTSVRATSTTRASRSHKITVGGEGTAKQSSAGVHPTPPPDGVIDIGTSLTVAKASWYAQGTRTANGDKFNPDGLTFAHRTMPFGQHVLFRYKGRTVIAVCTDRGPTAATGRTFDLSRGAFRALAPLGAGVIVVEWEKA